MGETIEFPDDTETIPCREVQRIRQYWVWGSLTILIALSLTVLPVLFVVIGVALVAYYTRLTTEVREYAVFIRLSPGRTGFERIPYNEIDRCEVTTLGRFSYGGPGLLRFVGNNTYSLVGRSAVEIHRKNGDPVLLGTQRPEELAAAIAERL